MSINATCRTAVVTKITNSYYRHVGGILCCSGAMS